MNILIVMLLLGVAIKRLVSGGLFANARERITLFKTKVENKESAILTGDVIACIVSAFLLLLFQVHIFYVGIMIPSLVIPTVIMFAHFVSRVLKQSEEKELGKYTIGSIAEDSMSVVYYAYFLYVLI